jgi:hypothetical protein
MGNWTSEEFTGFNSLTAEFTGMRLGFSEETLKIESDR